MQSKRDVDKPANIGSFFPHRSVRPRTDLFLCLLESKTHGTQDEAKREPGKVPLDPHPPHPPPKSFMIPHPDTAHRLKSLWITS